MTHRPFPIGRRAVRLGIWPLAALAFAGPARATLGEPETSVASTPGVKIARVALNAVRPGLLAHQFTDRRGVAVRQYAEQGGTVFAVTWQGPFKPDLRQLLGPHFDTYVQGAAGGAPNRGRVVVATPDVVIQSFGHMRSFTGRAWLPGALPAGLQPEQLQ